MPAIRKPIIKDLGCGLWYNKPCVMLCLSSTELEVRTSSHTTGILTSESLGDVGLYVPGDQDTAS